MSHDNVSSVEFRQEIESIHSRLGQLNERVHQLETRPQSAHSNHRHHNVSDEEDFDPYPENRHTQGRGQDHNRFQQNEQFRGGELKITPPTFAGKVDPEAYLDWEQRMDNIFRNYDYSEKKKIAIATAQLTHHAISWWERELSDGFRRGEEAIATWGHMKARMKGRFVPAYYNRDLQNRFRRLTQGSKSVEEYYEEFELLRNRLGCKDSEESLMAQFLDGLQERITRKVERLYYRNLMDVLHLATQVEQQIKRKTASSRSRPTYEPARANRLEGTSRPNQGGSTNRPTPITFTSGGKSTPPVVQFYKFQYKK